MLKFCKLPITFLFLTLKFCWHSSATLVMMPKFYRQLTNYPCNDNDIYSTFLSILVFFHKYSPFTGQQRKREAISLTPLYRFYPIHRHLVIRQTIVAESSPLQIASNHFRTRNLQFPNASRLPLRYAGILVSKVSTSA